MNTYTITEVDDDCVELSGELTIINAAALRIDLQEMLPASGALRIDLAGVAELDISGVQLLLAMQQQADATGVDLRLTGHSPVVTSVLRALWLDTRLGAPPALVDA